MSSMTEMRYTEEDLKIMEDFEDEMMRIHDNPLFYEDDMNLDEIEMDLIAKTSNLSANAREFCPSPQTLELAQATLNGVLASLVEE